MRSFILFCLCISSYLYTYGQFITTWRTTTPNESITIPINSSQGPYSYSVDFGDSNFDYNSVTSSLTHVYSTPGDYQVSIWGTFPALDLGIGGASNAEKLISLDKWGNQEWKTLNYMFQDAKNMVYNATDIPNLDSVTSAVATFYNCEKFNGAIGNWDVSTITNMGEMLGGNISSGTMVFDQDLGNWDIDQVTNMSGMFSNSGMSRANYDKTLIGWVAQNPTIDRTLGANGLIYCVGETARDALILLGWTISGDTEDCTHTFITEWNINSARETLVIPTNSNYIYNYDIDWDNDGTYDEFGITGDATHEYLTTGPQTVVIRGDFPAIYLNNGSSAQKLQRIIQWGEIEWQSMQDAFKGATNMTYHATDLPDLSQVTSLAGMFYDCSSLNQPLGNWNTSQITEMHYMFAGATSFNQDISTWNTSQVSNMHAMFWRASAFNRDIGNWNTAMVTSMRSMFNGATIFNQDLSNWDVYNVETMVRMFYQANAFDQSLGDWEIRFVEEMEYMLSESGMSIANYDATLIGWEDFGSNQGSLIEDVNLGAVGLEYCTSISQRDILIDDFGWTIDGDIACIRPFITTWRTTQANEEIIIRANSAYTYNFDIDWENDGIIDATGQTGDLSHTYAIPGDYQVAIYGDFPHFRSTGSTSIADDNNQLMSIDQWGAIAWKSMYHSFRNSINMTYLATDLPDLSMVNNFTSMFEHCHSFDGNIGDWDVSSATTMDRMFTSAYVFNQNIDDWDISRVKNIRGMFTSAYAFNQPLNSWETDSITDMSLVFYNAWSFNQPIDLWNTAEVTTMWGMFHRAETFNRPLNTWNISNVINMSSMFRGALAFNQNLISWNTLNVTDMSFMFADAIAFNRALVTTSNGWNTANVTNMERMFSGAIAFNQTLNTWNTLKVTNMSSMFNKAFAFNGQLNSTPNGWNTENVTNMTFMFYSAVSFNQPLNSWNTSSLTNTAGMFAGSEESNELTGTTMIFNQSLDLWDVSNVEYMGTMFDLSTSFDQSLANWDIQNVVGMNYMLDHSGLSQPNYDATLSAWSTQNVSAGVTLGAQGLEYCSSVAARQSLIDNGWTIEGDYECGTSAPCFDNITNINHSISSNMWSNAANWSEGRIPNGCDDVLFDVELGIPKEVTVDTDGICSTLEVPLGMSFVVDGYTLTVTPVEGIANKVEEED